MKHVNSVQAKFETELTLYNGTGQNSIVVLDAVVDSSAEVSLITKQCYEKYFHAIRLSMPSYKLVNFDNYSVAGIIRCFTMVTIHGCNESRA